MLAFASARYKRGETSLAEFCPSVDTLSDGTAAVLLFELLQRSVIDVWAEGGFTDAPTTAAVVGSFPVLRRVLAPLITAMEGGSVCPFPVDLAQLKVGVEGVPTVDDDGWMYRDIVTPEGEPSTVDMLAGAEGQHAVWLTDFF